MDNVQNCDSYMLTDFFVFFPPQSPLANCQILPFIRNVSSFLNPFQLFSDLRTSRRCAVWDADVII
jgi:hypothetical protein